MKRVYWSVLAGCIVVALSAGCAGQAPVPTVPPPAASPVGTAQSAGTVSASAVVEPAQTSSLAFLIAAPVKEVNVKAGDQVQAGQPLVVLDTPELAFAVTAAQAELDSATANAAIQRHARKKWNGSEFVYVSSPPEWKAMADARVLQAQAALDVARANLAQGTLVAPYDATVVSVGVVPGEMATLGKPVLVLGDLAHLQLATTDLSEREIASVHIGQPAATRLKAFDQDLPGKVIAIAPMSQIANGDTVFKVTIQLDQPP
ncbi:MAG: efflux RND transporter periplasmic adaptor subunit, partial [Anaerolineae bacterium]